MSELDKQIDALTSAVEQLSITVAESERNNIRVKRRYRMMLAGISGVFGMLLFLGVSQIHQAYAQHAATPPVSQQHAGLLARAERLERLAEGVLLHLEQQVAQGARKAAGTLEKDAAKAKETVSGELSKLPDTGALIALMLHDMKVAMETMPQMGRDMHAMNMAMQEMNMKMGVISHDIDGTMGRMNRWIPWGW